VIKTNDFYHHSHRSATFGKIYSSRQELAHIGIATAVLTIAFAIVIGSNPFWVGLLLAALSVFTGFIPHELGHKSVAQHFGAWAEFRASAIGLVVALVSSLFGFVLAAPGAVYVQGYLTPKQNGLVSLAGPGVNIVIALASMAASLLFPIGNLVGVLLWIIGSVNASLAAFNLLPVSPLDGSKVFGWSKLVWFGSISISVLLMAIGYGLL
jgi:Zn-dependent protease